MLEESIPKRMYITYSLKVNLSDTKSWGSVIEVLDRVPRD